MPIPKPNESEKDYVARCIPHLIEKEGKTQEQAAGQCYGMYHHHKKAARKRAGTK